MLLTKTVIVKWNGNNKKYYEKKGYIWTKNNDEFEVKVDDLSNENSSIVIPICEMCKKEWKDGIIYSSYYKNIKKNDGVYICPKCKMEQSLKTTQQFKKEIYNLVGEEYTLLGEYKRSNTKTLMRHNSTVCNNYEWEITPSKFLNGRRCPKCANNIKKSTEDFKEEVYDKFKNEYTILGEYKNTDTPIKVRHNSINCDYYEWNVVPKILLKGESKCPKCSKKLKKSTEDFKKEVYDLVGKEYSVIGEYIKSKEKILMKHNCIECNNYEYEVTPSNFLSGKRCPKCNESKGENKIGKYLLNNNFNYTPQMEFEGLIGLGGKNLSYDFYLPQYNLLIEYQGEYHDGTARNQTKEEFKRQIEHDKRKREYAKEHNIKLLEIWYWDFDNVEQILNKELIIIKNII